MLRSAIYDRHFGDTTDHRMSIIGSLRVRGPAGMLVALRDSVPAKADTVIQIAYRLGRKLREATFGPQPDIFQ